MLWSDKRGELKEFLFKFGKTPVSEESETKLASLHIQAARLASTEPQLLSRFVKATESGDDYVREQESLTTELGFHVTDAAMYLWGIRRDRNGKWVDPLEYERSIRPSLEASSEAEYLGISLKGVAEILSKDPFYTSEGHTPPFFVRRFCEH
jgi:hypothetical protein